MSGKIFTAERIISRRVHRGVTQYLIKWLDYPEKDNTWEPLEHIIDRGLLREFERRNPRRLPRNSQRRSPVHSPRLVIEEPTETSSNNHEQLPDGEPLIEESQSSNQHDHEEAKTDQNGIEEIDRRTPESQPAQAQLSEPESRQSPMPERVASPCRLPKLESPRCKTPRIEPPPKPPTPSPPESPPTQSPEPETTQAQQSQTNGIKEEIQSMQVENIRGQSTPDNTNDMSIRVLKRASSKFAVMNTVITDVTINNHTITICESKTNQGFFKEVSRNNVAVDTKHPGDE